MILGIIYTTKAGNKYMPLQFSDDKRFVLTVCKYKNKKTLIKWFWSCHPIFKNVP